MTIIQQPAAKSLTSEMKDFIVESDIDIHFEILLNNDVILDELYTPDISNRIHVKALGEFCENYLKGEFDTEVQSEVSKTFKFRINNVVAGNSLVLLCRAKSNQSSEAWFTDRFLNIQYRKKITVPNAKEFVTAFLNNVKNKVYAQLTYQDNGLKRSVRKVVYTGNGKFYTVDVSFSKVASLFPEIPERAIIDYNISLHESDADIQFIVDWETYLSAKTFLYLNSFGVPESLVCRGEIFRKGIPSFTGAKIDGIEHKYNIRRDDTFEVSFGKIYAQNDYLLFREMIGSEDVKCFFDGKYRKIIITEENTNINQKAGAFSVGKFTFRFADTKDNVSLIDNQWILETGVWNDKGYWFDSGTWNDNPV